MRNLMKKTLVASVLSAAAVCGSAHADMYFEVGATQVSDKVEGYSIRHMAAIAVGGTTLSTVDTLSHKVEGILIVGLTSDKIENVDVKLKSVIGAAYRPSIKLSDSVELYGRVGVFNGKAKASTRSGPTSSESSTELGYGVGFDISRLSISYLNVDGVNLLNATYRF